MISRESDYLNNKLKQLKNSVLNKNATENGDHSKLAGFAASQKYVPTYDEKDAIYANIKAPGKVQFQGPTDSNLFAYNVGSPVAASKVERNAYFNSKIQGSMTPSAVFESKRPHSHQIIDNLKTSEANISSTRAYPGTVYGQAANSSGIINPMEPRVKVIHASNSKSFIQAETPAFDFRPSNFQTPPVSIGTEYSFRGGPATVLRQTDYVSPALRTTTLTQTHFPSERLLAAEPEPEILRNLNQASFIEKHEGKILNEMQQKIANQIAKNNKLGEEIMGLRRGLEAEKGRLFQLDEAMKQEFRHAKATEAESVASHQALENKLHECTDRIAQDNDRHAQMRSELEKIQVENDMLRGELKRLGEITSEKILDLENNINSVARMKEFEVERFVMEKDKANNSADFVIEQMKVHFNDRSGKIEEQVRKIQADSDRLAVDLKAVTDELKSFNFNADQKINNIMNIVIQEEQEKHQAEARDIEGRLRAEEEEIARLNRRNQDILTKLQATERDGKNRLMARKNENTRLKEDLSNFEQNLNKLLIQVSNENREYEKKKEMVELAKEDYDEVHNKSQMLDHRYEEEMANIQAGHEETLQELDREFSSLREREQRLLQAIQQENEKINAIHKRHNDLIEDVQRNFNATLQSQFAGVGK